MPDAPPDERAAWWDRAYEEGEVPWDAGRPQPEIAALERAGRIQGRVLDIGCGTGVESRYLADRGHEVVGVDFSEPAVERARDRTDDDSDVSFRVGDAFALPDLDLGRFDTVVDCGLLHALEPEDRPSYTEAIRSVLADDGLAICLEFGPEAPDDWGPMPVSTAALLRAFGDGWNAEVVEPVPFETSQGVVPGVLGVADLVPGDGPPMDGERSA